MSEAPVPVEAMTDAQFDDFVEQLRWAVHEETRLWELPLGVLDAPDTHLGPWRAGDCASAVSAWFDAGLVGLYRWRGRHEGPHEDLTDAEARAILAAPARWVLEDDDAHACLVPTDTGSDTQWDTWVALVRPIRQGLGRP